MDNGMAKIANSTCTRCHQIKPRTEMQERTKTEYSGNSYSHSVGKNKNSSRSSLRMYNRVRKYWICNECAVIEDEETKQHNRKVLGWLGVAAVVIVFLFALQQ